MARFLRFIDAASILVIWMSGMALLAVLLFFPGWSALGSALVVTMLAASALAILTTIVSAHVDAGEVADGEDEGADV